MTTQSITPLRQRMIEDMTIRRLKPSTQDFYQRSVARFAQHFHRSPAELDYEHVRQYQLHLVQTGCQPVSVNRRMTALRFFYKISFDGERVRFKWKDYRRDGRARYGVATLDANEFMRRFLLHVLTDGFIASDTMACSLIPPAPIPSPRRARCSPMWHRQRQRTARRRLNHRRPRRTKHRLTRRRQCHVLVAAAP